MAFRITYGVEKEQKQNKGRSRCFFLTAGFFLCFLWSVARFWPEGRELLRTLLIPGDPEVTMEAAEVFAQELGCGYSLADAARNFCLSVLGNGYSG